MTKHYCDRCEKESRELYGIKIPTGKSPGGFSVEILQVCEDCRDEFNVINDKLTDIRLILFEGFVKEGTSRAPSPTNMEGGER